MISISINKDYSAVVIRGTLGAALLAHGLLKVFFFTIPGTIGYFESLGIPAIVAYLTIFGELAGGTALILGVYSRLAALLSLPILIGALWAHSANGWVFSNKGGGWEFPLFLIVIAIAVAISGNGPIALRKLPFIDNLIPQFFKV